ncbi:DEAD/DEAH box helicase [Lusitaniella coriacea LEGE 07157]|uniref:DEAD/DEAH box helicase n=1 Tax=Lusitaniella coriacea LEGE 07157 TaxID=945747 RepID=A0A8J7J6B9_9CYAN|nr:DEAD/DEAH box helicase [Lusitaniella coriacea]MBE9115555.1 DEAD/DEAH box helicase [Lusitaniella coriacea LEGE 07157]
MATLQGSWITKPDQNYFFLWGETWRPQGSVAISADEVAPAPYPFAMNPEELFAFAQGQNLSLNERWVKHLEKGWHEQILGFPVREIQGKKNRKKDCDLFLLPLSSEVKENGIKKDELKAALWKVEGLCLNAQETVQFIQELPLSSLKTTDSPLGSSLRFWSQVYRWSLDLLARCKFLPGLSNSQDVLQGYWQLLLDSAVDRARFDRFARLMPSVCRTYPRSAEDGSPGLIEPQALLLQFLNRIANAQLQMWLETDAKPMPKASIAQHWVQTLDRATPSESPETEQLQRLSTALQTWTSPIQDYLVAPDSTQLGGDRFRACFILKPPTEGEIRWNKLDWKLQYYLRSVNDLDVLLDAATLWQHPVDELNYQGYTIEKPQETLLKELGLAARLYPPIKASLNQRQPTQCTLNPIEVYEFIRARVWQLQDSGFSVILPPGLNADSKDRLGVKIKAKVARKKGDRLGLKSLLDYKLELAIGDKSLSKEDFERLLDQKSPLVAIDGEWIALQPADVRAAQSVLTPSDEAIQLTVEDALRLSTGETKTLAKLPAIAFEPAGVLKELIVNLTENKAIEPIETPEDFQGQLRPYQIRGVSWLAFLERWSLGACLADDMGLGKTPQLLAFLLHLQERGNLKKPTLVVCPTSVLGNWEREVKKFAPTLKTFVHHGDKRPKGKAFAIATLGKQLVLTSYSLVYRDLKSLETVHWSGVVLDEAQNIKNPQAKQSQAVRQLKAGFRIALTGTPVENRLSELWSILDFLNPGFLGGQQFFQRRFAIPIEKYGDRDSLYALRSLVQPFILRRLKTDKDIIQDLPEKQEMTIFCGLSTEQAKLYQKLVDESLSAIEEAEGIQRHGLILTLLLKLKQVCNHPAHYLKEKQLKKAERSGKLLRLQEMLEEMIAEGDRALIFTQFAEWGKLLKPYLEKKLGGEVLFLYGGTRRNQRQETIDRFQNDPAGPRILILSLKAGGTGLNLTRANHVFHVDRWWNPAVENQATDRAFRIGQKRNVQVHKFVCTGTLEERINEIIESKKQLAEQTVDAGEQWLAQMDTERLRSLLLLDRDSVIDEEG